MRLDRFITLNLVQPLRRITHDASRIMCLPVLMYHSVSDDPESHMHPYYRVCISPARFREQMQWLKDNGCRGVTLTEGLKSESEIGNQKSEIKKVVLTFDDGFRDFYTAAWPILQGFDFTATMYLPTASISDPRRLFAPSTLGSQHSTRKECLTWSEVKELHRAGIEFGSHTKSHPKLVELPWPAVELEIQKSKSEIEQHLGTPCAAFAYPYAFPQTDWNFLSRFKDLLLASAYETCVTTQLGRHRFGDDVLQIKRLPVNQDDDRSLFAAKLDGAYDWLGRVQSLSKTLRRKTPAQISTEKRQDVLGAFPTQPNTKNV